MKLGQFVIKCDLPARQFDSFMGQKFEDLTRYIGPFLTREMAETQILIEEDDPFTGCREGNHSIIELIPVDPNQTISLARVTSLITSQKARLTED
jgi:hypothetical protein